MAATSRRPPGLLLRGGVWHIDKVIYSAPEIGALMEASERVCELESRASPAISVVRSRA